MVYNEFEKIFTEAKKRTEIKVIMVGDRPCSNIDYKKIEQLKAKIIPIIEATIGEKVTYVSSSTDCNIPLSLGVAALCIGTNRHAKIHTREEWVDKNSLKTGLLIAIESSLSVVEGFE